LALLDMYVERRARLGAARDALLARAAASRAGDAGGQAEVIAELEAVQRRTNLDTVAFTLAMPRCAGVVALSALLCAAHPWMPPLVGIHAALRRARAARAAPRFAGPAPRSEGAAAAAPEPEGLPRGAER
jgi:hypothetical protein